MNSCLPEFKVHSATSVGANSWLNLFLDKSSFSSSESHSDYIYIDPFCLSEPLLLLTQCYVTY